MCRGRRQRKRSAELGLLFPFHDAVKDALDAVDRQNEAVRDCSVLGRDTSWQQHSRWLPKEPGPGQLMAGKAGVPLTAACIKSAYILKIGKICSIFCARSKRRDRIRFPIQAF
jgi:hypothetical protein